MFGIPDPAVWLAVLFCLLSTAACVLYGLVKWNSDGEKQTPADIKWAKEEKKIEKEL